MNSFKTCSGCNHCWPDREAFLSDPGIVLIGYQVHFRNLEGGLFLFNHSCTSTIALSVCDFTDLNEARLVETKPALSPGCPGFCLHKTNLTPCPQQCECVFVRDIIGVIRDYPKHSMTSA